MSRGATVNAPSEYVKLWSVVKVCACARRVATVPSRNAIANAAAPISACRRRRPKVCVCGAAATVLPFIAVVI